MIAVDTSALMAFLLKEPMAKACIDILEAEPEVVLSAGTLLEAPIVARPRGIQHNLTGLIARLGFNIVTVTAASARRAAEAYDKWGKGIDPAGLTFGDCFAYEVAKEHGCPLLFVGNDFSKTDIQSAR